MRGSLKQVVRAEAPVTESFEDRIRMALSAERERGERADPSATAELRMPSWRSIVPIAAASGGGHGVGGFGQQPHRRRGVGSGQACTSTAPASVEKLLEDLVRNHERSAGPAVHRAGTGAAAGARGGRAGEAAQLQVRTAPSREGVSIVPVNNQRAASLRYRIAGHKLTVYVYDASRFPVRTKLAAAASA